MARNGFMCNICTTKIPFWVWGVAIKQTVYSLKFRSKHQRTPLSTRLPPSTILSTLDDWWLHYDHQGTADFLQQLFTKSVFKPNFNFSYLYKMVCHVTILIKTLVSSLSWFLRYLKSKGLFCSQYELPVKAPLKQRFTGRGQIQLNKNMCYIFSIKLIGNV